MLICNCGWIGANLVAQKKDNTARCPECKEVFKGIPADSAVIVSNQQEKKLQEKARAGLWS